MTIGEVIGWLIMGLIVGAIARLLVPGRDPMGCLATILLGVAGSFVGGLIGRFIFGPPASGSYFSNSFWLALLGAIVLVLLWRMLRGRA